jgi:hypothetical protein
LGDGDETPADDGCDGESGQCDEDAFHAFLRERAFGIDSRLVGGAARF